MSVLESAIGWSKELEFLLQDGLGAKGKGLHEKLSSVEKRVPEALAKKIRFIASVRNKLVHEQNYQLDQPDAFAKAAEDAIAQLKSLIAVTASNPLDIRPQSALAEGYGADAVEKIPQAPGAKKKRSFSFHLSSAILLAPLRLLKRTALKLLLLFLLVYLPWTSIEVLRDAKGEPSLREDWQSLLEKSGAEPLLDTIAVKFDYLGQTLSDKADALGFSSEMQSRSGEAVGLLLETADKGVRYGIIFGCRVADAAFDLNLPPALSWDRSE